MSCNHEWTETVRCAKCGQGVESKAEGITALSRELDAALALLQRWKNRRNGNRKFQLWSDTTAFLKQQRAA